MFDLNGTPITEKDVLNAMKANVTFQLIHEQASRVGIDVRYLYLRDGNHVVSNVGTDDAVITLQIDDVLRSKTGCLSVHCYPKAPRGNRSMSQEQFSRYAEMIARTDDFLLWLTTLDISQLTQVISDSNLDKFPVGSFDDTLRNGTARKIRERLCSYYDCPIWRNIEFKGCKTDSEIVILTRDWKYYRETGCRSDVQARFDVHLFDMNGDLKDSLCDVFQTPMAVAGYTFDNFFVDKVCILEGDTTKKVCIMLRFIDSNKDVLVSDWYLTPNNHIVSGSDR